MLDLKIKGRKAIVCAASKGLGRACAMALARAGVDVVITARTRRRWKRRPRKSARDRRQGDRGGRRHHHRGGRAATLAACPEPDILVNNAGGPPHGDFRDWCVEDWQKAVNGNMLTPIMLIKAMVDGMCARKFGRIVNITSGSVKSPIPNLGMSNGARAGLTGVCRRPRASGRPAQRHDQRAAAGPFLTDRLAPASNSRRAGRTSHSRRCWRSAPPTNPAGRVGDPAEFGDACAFLCAASSGFIVGQNLLLDGGAFNSTMG